MDTGAIISGERKVTQLKCAARTATHLYLVLRLRIHEALFTLVYGAVLMRRNNFVYFFIVSYTCQHTCETFYTSTHGQ
jgi:hypothetical protein